MMNFIRKFWNDEEGQGMAEYALIIALVAIAVIAALTLLGPQIAAVFTKITTELGKVPATS